MLLVGLPDTTRELEADMVFSPSAVVRALRAGRAATTAGDRGAINIWKDDNNNWRGEVLRFMVSVELKTFKKQAAIGPWFKRWFKRIQ